YATSRQPGGVMGALRRAAGAECGRKRKTSACSSLIVHTDTAGTGSNAAARSVWLGGGGWVLRRWHARRAWRLRPRRGPWALGHRRPDGVRRALGAPPRWWLSAGEVLVSEALHVPRRACGRPLVPSRRPRPAVTGVPEPTKP